MQSTTNCPSSWIASALAGDVQPWPISNEKFSGTFFEIAVANGVVPLIYYTLHHDVIWQSIPKKYREAVTRFAFRTAIEEVAKKNELEMVLERFHENGLAPILLKGTPLAYSLYPEPHLRTRCDTDLFFADRKSAERAWELLISAGYQRPNSISGTHVSHQFSCFKDDAAHVRHTFDLHWLASNRQYLAKVMPYEELTQNTIQIDSVGPYARALSLPYALLFACTHRIAHKPQGTENRLIWLYDIHLISDHMNDHEWRNFRNLATDKNLLNACFDGIRESQKRFALTVPSEFAELMESEIPEESFTPEAMNSRWKTELANISELPSWKDKLLLIKEHLLPSKAYMKRKYAVSSPSLLPWFYVKRVSSGLLKLTTKPGILTQIKRSTGKEIE